MEGENRLYELIRLMLAISIFVVGVMVLLLVYDIGKTHQEIESKQSVILERLNLRD